MLSILACKRSKVIVPLAVFAYWPGGLFWELPLYCCVSYWITDAVRVYRQGVPRLCVAVGSDKVLGCHCDHKPHQRTPLRRQNGCCVGVRRLQC